jgi:FkbM family methyltransferase
METPVLTRIHTYAGKQYSLIINEKDPSADGCVVEIIHRDEYHLSNFQNIEGAHFIDIGANCGVATCILAKQNPLSTVLAFEPDKEVFKVLSLNVQLNNLTNVKLYNMAVSKKGVSELTLTLHPSYSGGNTTYSNKQAAIYFFNNQSIQTYTVPVTSLDAIIEEHSISNLPLLKIDCEGAEFDILYDSEYLKKRYIKNIVGEFHKLSYNQIDPSLTDDPQKLKDYCAQYVDSVNVIFLFI